MAYTTIDDPSAYFQTATYTGNAGTLAVVNDGNSDLQPDWVWCKRRDVSANHVLYDSSRGASKVLYSNLTDGEETVSGVTAFNTDGFTLGSDGNANASSGSQVAWQWKANGGTTSSNSDGSITSTVQTGGGGFSIVTYTGNRTAGATVGHGLGVAPSMVIAKCRTASAGWPVFHASLGGSNFVRLNETSASASNSVMWNNTAPSSSVVTLGGGDETNNDTGGSVMYCFAEIKGYSKFGSYTGNGNADGPFVYTGFKPAFVIYKRTSAVENWQVLDSKRDIDNPVGQQLYPNLSASEGTENRLDFTSNGFKLRNSGTICNASGSTYIYMAFAEHPFVSSKGVPVTAR